MNPVGLFPAPAQWLSGAHIAKVVSVQDPQSRSRVQVQLLSADPEGTAPIWARVAVPFAGDNYGAFFIPDVGCEVIVQFLAGDTANPIVIGTLWNGKTGIPETLPGNAVDRWAICGKNGTRIAIVEESSGQEMVEIETPAGAKATLTDQASGSIKLEVAGNTFEMSTSGVSIQTSSQCEVQASTVTVTASSVSVNTSMATFSGTVQCNTLIASSVVSSSYTPGAGNVW
ncbi:phage baseplate assembly protein V [Sphingomonas psychrotolerans]|uniref:Phage baseplate assembly protein V n=1 Tax=Sphingomonas psychrotolerans TaxID=1327635 RepID=A0ABU3N8Q1_9SPHN|nr:phage baseplate assembly protein V [Sphingomonas psychrotolerans]MDT8760254.1 phage baseplate assembly protein V [Sphingomonas psychrotolerans]